MIRRLSLVVIFIALVASGCGGGRDSKADTPANTSTATATPKAETVDQPIADPEVPADVASKFGGEAMVIVAYKKGAGLVQANQYNDRLGATMRGDFKKSDMRDYRDFMTAKCRGILDGNIDDLASIDTKVSEEAKKNITPLVNFEGTESEFVDPDTNKKVKAPFQTDVPSPFVDRKITNPEFVVDDEGRLKANFDSAATILATKGGKDYRVSYVSHMTLWLDPEDGKLLIGGWYNNGNDATVVTAA